MNLIGTARHQQILEAITNFYAEDKRVLSILLFGSLSCSNWDEYSDLDLDIVMANNVAIDARIELKSLCEALKQTHGFDALIIADAEEGDVVLSNLVEFSIRYHILSDTKPAILETMRSLSGALSLDDVRTAANYDHVPEPSELVDLVNAYIRYTLGLHNAIMRERVWMALDMLHRKRNLLMSVYAISHSALRPAHFFDSDASPELQALLSTLSPQPNLTSIENAFRTAILLLDNHLEKFCNGAYQLTSSQKQVLYQLKQLELYQEG